MGSGSLVRPVCTDIWGGLSWVFLRIGDSALGSRSEDSCIWVLVLLYAGDDRYEGDCAGAGDGWMTMCEMDARPSS